MVFVFLFFFLDSQGLLNQNFPSSICLPKVSELIFTIFVLAVLYCTKDKHKDPVWEACPGVVFFLTQDRAPRSGRAVLIPQEVQLMHLLAV